MSDESLSWSVLAASGAKLSGAGGATLTLADFLLARIREDEAAAAAEGIPNGFRDGEPVGPSRVLEECAAKRRIVDLALRTVASVYADHPDYRAEWAL